MPNIYDDSLQHLSRFGNVEDGIYTVTMNWNKYTVTSTP
jgi:hypothetical protein